MIRSDSDALRAWIAAAAHLQFSKPICPAKPRQLIVSKGYFRSSFLMVTVPDVAGRDIEPRKVNSLLGLVRPGVSAEVQSKAHQTRPTARVCLTLGAAWR